MQLHPTVTSTRVINRFKTLELDFISKHNNKYTYKNVVYRCAKNKVLITCLIHGDFLQRPSEHLQGAGCLSCAKEVLRSMHTKYTNKCLLTEAQKFKTQAELINYSTTIFSAIRERGKIFMEKAFKHMPKAKKSNKQFLSEVKKRVGETYIFQEPYIGSDKYINVKHILCGTIYKVKPKKFLEGTRCPSCRITGFDKSKPAILYYLKIKTSNKVLYKIGITNRTIIKRFSKEELSNITILNTWMYTNGNKCYNREQTILVNNKQSKYLGLPVLKSGNTELFIKDILNKKDYDDITNDIQKK